MRLRMVPDHMPRGRNFPRQRRLPPHMLANQKERSARSVPRQHLQQFRRRHWIWPIIEGKCQLIRPRRRNQHRPNHCDCEFSNPYTVAPASAAAPIADTPETANPFTPSSLPIWFPSGRPISTGQRRDHLRP